MLREYSIVCVDLKHSKSWLYIDVLLHTNGAINACRLGKFSIVICNKTMKLSVLRVYVNNTEDFFLLDEILHITIIIKPISAVVTITTNRIAN